MAPQPAERLLLVDQFARQIQNAGHGQKGKIVADACQLLGVKPATFYRANAEVSVSTRKKRIDAGAVELPRIEAELISAYMMEGYRAQSKRMVTLETAVDTLRANGKILAAVIDPATGEILRQLSYSAIRRALEAYTLHPKQLRQATPHIKMKSLHPNHVWQVDGSVCVVFYLPGKGSEICELDEAVHYKNKPENLRAIEQFRVIRMVCTDHATDATLWRYYPHAESGAHTVRFLAWCMAEKADPRKLPVHGRPEILMVDLGATSGGLVKRFCKRLGIEMLVSKRRNPREKGSVEKGNHRVEINFEQGLRFARRDIRDFDDLNDAALTFQIHYNATRIHTRHGMTRFAAWMHIRAEHLVKTGPEKLLLSLATGEPKHPTVSGNLTVQFHARTWRVDSVPGVLIGGKIAVHWHPFIPNTAMAITEDADGREIHHQLVDVTGNVDPYANEWGFQTDAAIIGEERKSRPDTLADTHRKKVQAIAAGTNTLEETEKKRGKKDFVPFDGGIDPFLQAKTEETPTYLPKQGATLEIAAPTVERIKLPLSQAGMRMGKALGRQLEDAEWTWLENRHPGGITEDAIGALIAQWSAEPVPMIEKQPLTLVK